jgi:hypothetical protein
MRRLCPQLAKADAASARIWLVQPTETCLGGHGRHKVDDYHGGRARGGTGSHGSWIARSRGGHLLGRIFRGIRGAPREAEYDANREPS